MLDFVSQTVLKRDLFSETHKGHLASAPQVTAIRRVVTASPLWTRPIAWTLARREIAALKAVSDLDIQGTPRLFSTDHDGLVRAWTEGAPLHLSRPSQRLWYDDAFRLLRALRRAGITHNDLAKPQNWLMTPDGRAAVIDFQLASRHRRRGPLYRLLAYEDFRHLLKQMAAFAPELMTPTARRVLARRSLPSRIWMATGKKIYNLITRGIFKWSDGEGTHDRLEHESADIKQALGSVSGVRDIALTTYPLPRKGVGVYAFVEAADTVTIEALERAQARLGVARADLIQLVSTLPRTASGEPRLDILNFVAMNQIPELSILLDEDEVLTAIMAPIIAGRLNYSDRRISRHETANMK